MLIWKQYSTEMFIPTMWRQWRRSNPSMGEKKGSLIEMQILPCWYRPLTWRTRLILSVGMLMVVI